MNFFLRKISFLLSTLLVVLVIFITGVEIEEKIPEVIEEKNIEFNLLPPPNLSKDLHTVSDGENLSIIFEKYKVPLNTSFKIYKQDIFGEIKNIKAGDSLEFEFFDDELKSILIRKNSYAQFLISLEDGISIKKIKGEPELINFFKSGVIDSSFYISGLKENIPESIIMDLAYIYRWDIDFVFDIRAGDKFKILFEIPFINGEQIENGSILYAEFYNKNTKYTAIRHNGKNKKWKYFDEYGGSLEKAFLRAPLDFAYVSSHFNPNRRHPILNKIRAHNGVDYAAKRGTPIRATGMGVIQSVGWKSGYGRTIVIRHGGEITTLYAHMDKYHPSISKGVKVSQGQTIGYVGDSGLATAPHLHYEFRIGQKRTDPLKVALPSANPIDKSQMDQFKVFRNNYIEITDQLLSKDPNENLFR
tara:strand:- start:66 stop:1313 length:1248 start_codon:yes stop_codon:yes gene_type:complete